ncbi:DNA-packaging protein [Chitinophaga pendula]|uniref:terminase small subunit n=1 Tax=Chitinophaga TaxID=79328 RepID=UPI000BAFCBDC|nr:MULTISPECIES: terminase small subunit [Chitinophaga]ASZ14520.1 hypothetical protein CK934_28015 [Chitinophaga sp. MD30]UCJ07823.1 DNA-packaging protein [Chitinophaga pendula]
MAKTTKAAKKPTTRKKTATVKKAGRPLAIETPEALTDNWERFKEHCDKKHFEYVASAGKKIALPKRLVYTLERFMVWLRISRETWSNYKERPPYLDAIKRIEEEVFARKKEAMINAEGSTAGLIFDMKANYGINEKTVIQHEGGFDITMDLGGPGSESK